MKNLITHFEDDGTPILFEGSNLQTNLRNSKSKKLIDFTKQAYKNRPDQQFWYDANEFVKNELKL